MSILYNIIFGLIFTLLFPLFSTYIFIEEIFKSVREWLKKLIN